jgi:CheY-like chemotaxis protein
MSCAKVFGVKLLLLEDDPFDIELTQIGCRDAWVDCEIEAVGNRRDYLAALERGGFDGIISDSGVADLGGDEALRFARERAPGVPFIFLCGAVSGERREELLAAGPDAMVSKDNRDQVIAALQRHFRSER